MTGAPDAARRMARAACAFLEGLPPELRAAAQRRFGPERRDWTYLPGERPGLVWRRMDASQREAALRLLETGLSPRAAGEVRAIMQLESVLADLEQGSGPRRDPEAYWLAVFGDPAGAAPFAWRVGGHHVGVHFTVTDRGIAVTPCFLGAHPATIRHGPRAGTRTLAPEEDLARTLLSTLEGRERAAAIVSASAPDDIRTGDARRADLGAPLRGLGWSDMRAGPREALARLVRHYVTRVADDIAAREWRRVESDLEALHFAWAGSPEPGHGHYYAVTGSDFVIEYDNTQNDANHIHSVWRRFEGDWGDDLLARHYADAHPGGR